MSAANSPEEPLARRGVAGASLGALATIALVLTALSPSAGRAQEAQSDDERARAHFDSGRVHFEDGAYDRALSEFTRAYELSGRPALLRNLAVAKARLGRHADAAADIRAYLEAVPDDEDRPRLERQIENLERLAAEGAAAPGPQGPDMEEEGATPRSPAVSPGSPDEGLMLGAIVSYAVAGAGLLTMAIFGSVALSEHQALANGCGEGGLCSDAEVADTQTFSLVSDVGLGLGLAGVAVGTTLLILALMSADEPDSDFALAPWASPRGAGAAMRLRF